MTAGVSGHVYFNFNLTWIGLVLVSGMIIVGVSVEWHRQTQRQSTQCGVRVGWHGICLVHPCCNETPPRCPLDSAPLPSLSSH